MTAPSWIQLLERTRDLWRQNEDDRLRKLDDTCKRLALVVGGCEWSAQDVLAVAVAGAEQGWPTQLLGVCVEAARRRGASWREVGEAFSVSRQAAHQRFVLFDGTTSPTKDQVQPPPDEGTSAKQATTSPRVPDAQLLEVLAEMSSGGPMAAHPGGDGYHSRIHGDNKWSLWKVPAPDRVPIAIFDLALRSLSLRQEAYAMRLLGLVVDDSQLGPTARRLLAQIGVKGTGVRRSSEGDPH